MQAAIYIASEGPSAHDQRCYCYSGGMLRNSSTTAECPLSDIGYDETIWIAQKSLAKCT